MSDLELIIRIAAFTELVLVILLLFTQRANNRSYRYAALLLVGIASYLLAPMVAIRWQWGLVGYPIILMAILVPALFWYFANAVFSDEAVPRSWVKWLLLATAVAGIAAYCPGVGETCQTRQWAIPGWIAQMAKLLWIVAAFITIGKDWHADLVAPRRRLRLLIVAGGGGYIAVVLMVELFLQDKITANLELVNASVLLLAVSALCFHFLSLRTTNVFARMAEPTSQADQQISPLAKQVLTQMEDHRAFASDPLTIKTLADELRTQPHQLRQVINGELGYRNFNAFINLYRIKEVAARLEQDEYRNTSLLTLALDAGFRSLAPFNRTFKDHFGVTPSEFRQRLEKPN
jgi:AraC-like DNA-binding protein